MHEFSLVECLLDEVDRVIGGPEGVTIVEIHVQCGPLAGVEPELLAAAFESQAPLRVGRECRLVLEQVPLRASCNKCSAEFEPSLFDFRCSVCGAGETRVIAGDSLILRSIVFDEPELAATGGEGRG